MIGLTAFAAALLDARPLCPLGLKAWNGSDPGRRFAVYRNNVIVALIDALSDAYPATLRTAGADRFRAAARDYARTHPPRSPVMAHYGAQFTDFVATHPATTGLAYLPELARLEWLYVMAFHAADVEAVAPEAVAALASDIERLPRVRLRLHPSLAVLQARHAVVSLWAAREDLLPADTVDPCRPESALVLREDLQVGIRRVSDGAARFIAWLQRGARLGTAAADALRGDAAFDLAQTLGLLIRVGAIGAILTDGKATP